MLSCRLPQCLGPVNPLATEGCSETRPAMHLSITFFGLNNFGNPKALRLNFLSKCSNFHLGATKDEEKVLGF